MTLGIDYRTKSHDASHHQTTSTNTPTLTFQPTTTHHHPSHHPPPPPKPNKPPISDPRPRRRNRSLEPTPSWRVASARRVGKTCSAPCNLDILPPVALSFLPLSCQWEIRNGGRPHRSYQTTRVQSTWTLYPGVVDREILSLGGYFWRAGLSRLWVMAEWPGEGEIELCERWGGGVCGRLKRARQARFAMTSSSSRAYQEVTFTR